MNKISYKICLTIALLLGSVGMSWGGLLQMSDYNLRETTLRAEQGDVRAQNNLGTMFEFGEGVPQNDKTAVKWYRLAAEQGDAEAQNNLGNIYYSGKGVPKDDKIAVKWYRLAAEQGHAHAQFNLGSMYLSGEGVPQDNVYAYMWFNISSASGFEPAAKNRDSIAKKLTPADLSAAQTRSTECFANNFKDC